MKIKKARVLAETQGLDNSFKQNDFKPDNTECQQIQGVFDFAEPTYKKLKHLGMIECFDCRDFSELDGYRFALVPLCRCCRTKREVEITNNRFERRMKK